MMYGVQSGGWNILSQCARRRLAGWGVVAILLGGVIVGIHGLRYLKRQGLAELPGEQETEPAAVEPWVVVIDPGHGGEDAGAVGAGGLEEKDVTLALGLALRRELELRSDIAVVMTRTGDVMMLPPERAALANRSRADIFIALHVNSWTGRSVSGYETFYYGDPSDEHVEALTAIEGAAEANAARPQDAVSLSPWEQRQYHRRASRALAELVQSELVSRPGLKAVDRGVKQGRFGVLRLTRMPAVLVELGFISNPAEEMRLRSEEARRTMVDALADSLLTYRDAHPQGFRLLRGYNSR